MWWYSVLCRLLAPLASGWWSDSIESSISIHAPSSIVLPLLQSSVKLDSCNIYHTTSRAASPSPPSPSSPPSPPAAASSAAASSSSSSSFEYPVKGGRQSTHFIDSTGSLLLPFLFDDRHQFVLEQGEDGSQQAEDEVVVVRQREELSGLLVWLGRAAGMSWYKQMLSDTREGYDRWNEALKEKAEAELSLSLPKEAQAARQQQHRRRSSDSRALAAAAMDREQGLAPLRTLSAQ